MPEHLTIYRSLYCGSCFSRLDVHSKQHGGACEYIRSHRLLCDERCLLNRTQQINREHWPGVVSLTTTNKPVSPV